MISSSSILAMLLPALVLAVAALPLLYRGWRGRIINDHPFCRGCGFNLFGLTQPAVCPECGRALGGPAAIRVGERRREKGWLATGLVILGLGVAWSALAVADHLGQLPSNQLKPTWWLIAVETRRPGSAVAAALDELALRSLTPGQEADLVQRALAIQADAKQPWLTQWGALVEGADIKGTLSAQDLQRYLLASGDPQPTIRSRLREGQKVAIQLAKHPRVSDICPWVVSYRWESFLVDGQDLLKTPGSGGESSLSSGGSTSRELALPLPVTGARQPRMAEYSGTWKVEYYRGFDSGAPPRASRQLHFRGQCTIVPEDQPSAEAVEDPAQDDAVRSSVRVLLNVQRGRQPIQASVVVDVSSPPLPLAFAVVLEQASKETEVGKVHFQPGASHGWSVGPVTLAGDEPLRIRLRPSQKAAEESVDIERFYLGPDIVFTCDRDRLSTSGWRIELKPRPTSATQPAGSQPAGGFDGQGD